jgi:hypothetical protein
LVDQRGRIAKAQPVAGEHAEELHHRSARDEVLAVDEDQVARIAARRIEGLDDDVVAHLRHVPGGVKDVQLHLLPP